MGKYSDMLAAEMQHSGSQSGGSKSVDWQRGNNLTWSADVQPAQDAAGLGTSLRVGMVEDPQAQMAAYARARFPNDPNAVSRYGMLDGDVVYRGDDGKVYRETGALNTAAEFLGSVAGPVAGSAAGAAGGTAFGMTVGGPVGAAIGGAGGLALTKLGGLAQADRQSAGGNAWDIGLEGLLSWAGAKLGDVFAKRVSNRRVVRDLPKLQADDTNRLMESAKRFGIQLTPGEATNLGSLLNQQKRFGQGMDEAGDVIRNFYGDRANQVFAAIDDFIGQTPSAAKAGISLREVATQALNDADAARKTASGPLYRSLDKANPMIDERAFMQFEEDDVIREFIDKAVSNPRFGVMDEPRNSYRVIDRAGKLMRDEAEALAGGAQPRKFEAGVIEQARQRLLGAMDEVVPGYKDARKAFASGSEYVDELAGGFEGVMAKVKDPGLARLPKDLLTSEKFGPGDVSRWKRLFESQGRGKDWNKLVNVWLRDVWESKATKGRTVKSLSGARFAEMIFGTPRQQKMLQEALDPKRYGDLKRLVEVLEATGRAGGQQSMTEPAMQAAKKEMTDAAPVKTFMRNLNISDPLGEIRELLISRDVEKWRSMIAKVIASPEAMSELEKLRVLETLSPKDETTLRRVAGVLTRSGVLGGAAVVSPTPPDIQPQMPSRVQQ